ncbi:MAG TPA: hypothetical protein DIW50_01005 [Prolixibacteraceae bacterium]|nr:hypothetical protein [Prolixibacteraceae bacterium]
MKKSLQMILFCILLLPAKANEIDRFIFRDKQQNNQLCSDEVFLRRTCLTLTGRLPQAEKSRLFLSSDNTTKRADLIDELLDSDECTQYLVMRWGDILRIKSEFPSNLWPNAVQAYNRWLYEKIKDNTPYNKFVSELLLSKGSNFRSPAVNFYRAFLKRSPENIYENISLLFLGDRICNDNGHFCFSQIRYKNTKEWKEEIVYVDLEVMPIAPKIEMFNQQEIVLNPGEDWRSAYVAWLTGKQNKRFAGVMANRLWFWLTGQGIVSEPDDWGKHNPPSNPELMNYLTDRFIESGYDMKALMRLILNSGAYQSAASPQGVYVPQRLPAEVIVDVLADLTGTSDSYWSRVPEPFTFYPEGTRSVDLGDATVSSPALELFGRATRDVSLESQRSNKLMPRQMLYLMNSSELERRIQKSNILNEICSGQTNTENVCRAITLMTLSRYPSAEEINLFKAHTEKNGLSLRDLASDILWTHINSAEFLFNH